MRATAIRWWSAPPPPSPWSKACSASIGRRRRRCICRAATCRSPAPCSPTARSPTPMPASCAKPKAPAATASRRSSARAKIWSQGFVAEAIDKFCRTQEVMDVTGEPHRGVLTGADMAKWQASVEAPLAYDYGRYTVCKAGVWSQGPVLLQQLALLKGFDLDGLDPAGPEFIHAQVECAKLAFADRESFYGDPEFTEVPIKTLLSDKYNDARRKLVTDKASLELRPGSIEGFRRRRGNAPRGRRARRGRQPRRRRADGRAPRRSRRRHRAFRHHRPRRQHGVVDAVRRLAAILAGHPRARLRPRHPHADVLA